MLKKFISIFIALCTLCIPCFTANAETVADFVKLTSNGVETAKAGYFGLAYEDEEGWYCVREGLRQADSVPDLFERKVGEVLFSSYTEDINIRVYYSVDGKNPQYSEFTAPKVAVPTTTAVDTSKYLPTVSYKHLKTEDGVAKFEFSYSISEASKSEGATLRSVSISSSEGEYHYQNYLSGKTSDTITVPMKYNGVYSIKVTDSMGYASTRFFTVDTIKSNLETTKKSEPLELVCTPIKRDGLVVGDTTIIRVVANKPCTINIAGTSITGTQMDYTISRNGTYIIEASDTDGGYVKKEVTVDFYSSLPSSYYDEDNRDSQWTGDISKLNVKIDDGVISVLPKTGELMWYILLPLFALMILVGTALILHSKGIIKLPVRKKVVTKGSLSMDSSAHTVSDKTYKTKSKENK